ncbi:peptide-methionine (S)-S-oxide reductase [Oceanimonas sp. MB9]|uniref:peptide-methionine (S)-S-oxide reductase n=1 Tax=Oceanimonas sp. MB9 TaxID=2588453 RepID=UPI0013F60329|nr:peptide-methionine (S)-S-oxide reductase [Oceanimonas sp. MB9]NHI01899.1 Peptide methionine sulfoxide reductase MsrA [Oceanimonas sp. MB9]
MYRVWLWATLWWLPACLAQGAQQAVFAGGSFWVMEALFSDRPGIERVETGWMQSGPGTARRQVVRVHYNDAMLTYGDLLTLYWQAVDIHDGEGQYCDRGREFTPALYVRNALQLKWARQSRARLALAGERTPAVRILPSAEFEPAASRHQDYQARHPLLYFAYRRMCGYPDGGAFSLHPLLTGRSPASGQ